MRVFFLSGTVSIQLTWLVAQLDSIPSSNIGAYIAGGSLAISAVCTVASSVVALVTFPAWNFAALKISGLEGGGAFAVSNLMLSIVAVTIPLFLGWFLSEERQNESEVGATSGVIAGSGGRGGEGRWGGEQRQRLADDFYSPLSPQQGSHLTMVLAWATSMA